ncbi:MAG: 3-dehydroquinate synthase [Myxococcota bacterium]|nr:3-dehydroquinate synthase [Myxococcota bacterium]
MKIAVELGSRRYPIYFRSGGHHELVERTIADAASGRVIIVSDKNVAPLYATEFTKSLTETGLNAKLVTIPVGEHTKTLDTVKQVYETAVSHGVDRQTHIVAYGGGVVGDIAGFVASTLLRGLPFAQIPTTVLAQVDSSVGGKVGVNFAGAKNMIGSFYQPKWVFIDTKHLDTLPVQHRRSGLAEAVKHGFLGGEKLLTQVTDKIGPILMGDGQALFDILPDVVRLKAEIVREDELEVGRRVVLNLGHTLGHAFETDVTNGSLNHGDAVALGLGFCLAMSTEQLGLSERERALGDAALAALGGPTNWSERINDGVFERVLLDKKNRGDTVRIIGLRKLAEPVVLDYKQKEFRDIVCRLAEADRERKLR